MDNEARKQLLLTRIAMERAQWTREIDDLQRAANPKQLVSAAVRSALPVAWLTQLLGGSPGRSGATGQPSLVSRLAQGLMSLRRHPVLWPILAGAVPWVRRRGRVGRRVLWVSVGTGVAVVAAAAAVMLSRRAASNPTD